MGNWGKKRIDERFPSRQLLIDVDAGLKDRTATKRVTVVDSFDSIRKPGSYEFIWKRDTGTIYRR